MEKETVIGRIPTAEQMTVDPRTAGEIAEISQQAGALRITNEDDYAAAAELAKDIKRKAKIVKDFYAPVKTAANNAHKVACEQEKTLLAPLLAAESAIKSEMGRFTMERERARREAEEAARRAREAEAALLLERAAALDEAGETVAAAEALDDAQIMQETPSVISRSAAQPKGVSQKRDYVVYVDDASKVPVEIMGACIRPIDLVAVRKLVKATDGKIKIPGIIIEETVSTTIRTN